MNSEDYLKHISSLADEEIDLARAALALAALAEDTVSVERYENHLKKIGEDVAAHYERLTMEEGEENAILQLEALKAVLAAQHEYAGDTQTYDDLRNASLIQVIDRRRGLPVTLAILYIHAGRALNWDINSLDFPGHFLCRIQKDGRRLIFDPFNGAQILQASDLRALLKKVKGQGAELSADYFEPASSRSILLRLQNNIKYRQIEAEDYVNALKTVERMRLVDSGEYRLLLDAGVLYARTGQPMAAAAILEDYIARIPQGRDRQEAERLLRDIRQTLN
ncbi:MAG: SirB1 family protein [Alphaproteobacteria bacterium]